MSPGIWRQVLSALSGEGHDDADRERLLALGAAELAHARSTGEPVTTQDVQRIAYEEFSLLIDDTQARTALRARRSIRG
ncbi:hypothetical protein [Streptomyces sp. H27-C3]|uniref:hypothetical protein n=1 Tax=Streptomyces sp. H27-C3 TaxID=3046305 RepID=UPI0024BB53DE|nr:hypothetical protein [Streptomyces sp. H27-C3]MDJ0467133.1 hypothetical protein [Streptomyces sp. H27-C3]